MKTLRYSIIVVLFLVLIPMSNVFGYGIGPTVTIQLQESPLKQFESGIQAEHVTCQKDFVLVIKVEDSSPACVKTDTAFHLSLLGWGYLPSTFVTKTDLLDSKITGGIITGFHYDLQSASIMIEIQAASNGSLTVTIPKVLTDFSPHYLFKNYHTVLVDGMEENIKMIPTVNGSSFTIPFPNGSQEIEIIGAHVGQGN